jgi:hypothetical protein
MTGPHDIAKDILVAVLSQAQSSLSLRDEPEIFGETVGKVYKKIFEAVVATYPPSDSSLGLDMPRAVNQGKAEKKG